MARRSHTETFVLMRNNALKHRSFYPDFNHDDDEKIKLVNGKNEYHDEDINSQEIVTVGNESAAPSWLASIDEFRYDCARINGKIEQLNAIQEEHLKQKATSIFADESLTDESYEVDIELKCQEINKLFNRLHSFLMQVQSLSQSNPNSKLLKNVFQWQVRQVTELTQQFRSCQRGYLNRRNENEMVDKEFVITFEDFADNSFSQSSSSQLIDIAPMDGGDEPAESFAGLSLSQRQQQLHKSTFDSEMIRTRDQEMTTIVKSMSELNQIFHDINMYVINQGTLLDRIDYNLEMVQSSVESGVDYLRKAEKSMRSARKLKLILILSGVVVLLLLYVVIFKS